MHFGDEEKPGRKAALQKLVDLMGGKTSEKLASRKKPAAMAIEVEGSSDEEAGESADEESLEGEPSEEDKAKIAELYHKYCR